MRDAGCRLRVCRITYLAPRISYPASRITNHDSRFFCRTILAIILAMTATISHALDIQGHRGARGLAPENTLPAFARALAIGVTTLELACALPKDGGVVVTHDP